MLTLTTTVLFLALVYLLSYLYFQTKFTDWELPEWVVRKNRPGRWEERFGRLKGWWGYVTLGSAVVGIGSTLIVHAKLYQTFPNVWFPDLMFGLLGFYLTFMAITDFFTQKAPFDVQDLTLAIVAPIGVLGLIFNLYPKNYIMFAPYDTHFDSVLQAAPFLVFVLILAVLFFRGLQGIGFADIVVFGIVGFGLGAMIGVENMLIGLLSAAVLQLLAFVGAQIWGWGTIVPTPYTRTREIINGAWFKLTKSNKPLMGEESRQLAWLPMICLSYLAIGLILV